MLKRCSEGLKLYYKETQTLVFSVNFAKLFKKIFSLEAPSDCFRYLQNTFLAILTQLILFLKVIYNAIMRSFY